MLFNSYIFILLFMPITLIGYFAINKTKRYQLALLFLCAMSLWFYAYFNLKYLWIIGISILANYILSKFLVRSGPFIVKKIVLSIGVFGNLTSIFYYKYYDFFITNMNGMFGTDFALKYIVLPLGISFFTFQQIAFLVDSYKGNVARYTFVEYVTFIVFFPQLVAGPIVMHDEIFPQLRDLDKKVPNYENLSIGLYSFAMGLGKKVLLADSFSKIVITGYGNIDALDSTNAIVTMLAFSLQLYFDFSGYSDMAVGLGKMFNIDIIANFNSPFKAKDVVDLWKRWHISLNRFLIKYVYIPLGGNRGSALKTFINTLIVFFLSGIWHGANWTFIVWGTINGLVVIIYKMSKGYFNKLPRIFNSIISFIVFNLTFVFFRAESVQDGVYFLKKIVGFDFGKVLPEIIESVASLLEIKLLARLIPNSIETVFPGVYVYAIIMLGLVGVFVLKNTQEKVECGVINCKCIFSTVIILAWSILSFSGVSEFLYFNF